MQLMAHLSQSKGGTDLSEKDWIDAARTGNRDAFAKLAGIHGDALFRWACHIAPDVNTAEDVVQETLLKAMTRLHQFQPGTKFRAWLFRIGFNTFANLMRSRKKREQLVGDVPQKQPGLLEKLQKEESLRNLAIAIQNLPVDFRTALMVRVEGELSFKEVAEIVGTTEETARWRVFKARKILLERVPQDAPEGVFPS